MVSSPQNPTMAPVVCWRRWSLVAVTLLHLLSFAPMTTVILSSSFAVVKSEEQSFANVHLQSAPVKEIEEEGKKLDSQGHIRILRESFDSSSLAGRGGNLRGFDANELTGEESRVVVQQDPNGMTGQGGWKNRARMIDNGVSAAVAVPSTMAMPTATMSVPYTTLSVPSAMTLSSATMAVPSAMSIPYAAMSMPAATMAMPAATMAMPAATMAMPAATMAMPAATMAMPAATMAMPAATMAMPAATMAMPTTTMAMPATSVSVPTATMAMPTATMASPMAAEYDGLLGGGIFQKIKSLKMYLGLKKYAKYANVAGYNTYGNAVAAGSYPLYVNYSAAAPAAALAAPAAALAATAAKDYSGYNTYNGNNSYTGFSAPTEGGLAGKKARYTEEPGQRYLAQVISKNRTGWWLSNKVSRLADVLGGVLPQGVDQPVLLANGYETREAMFLAVLQNRERFVDLLVQDQLLQEQPVQRQWIGRMYTEVQGGYSGLKALERDFAISKMAPPTESLASFRHSLRLDIPIDLYEISGLSSYVQAPDGQVFLNAISRRPLIRATAETVMGSAGSGKKAYRALLSLSQQAVRTVANLNCLLMVHTNVNPRSFLVTEKGLVFLGGLFQATQQGASLVDNYQYSLASPVFIPPELRDNTAYYNATAQPSQDAWQLGMTLFTFWCSQLSVDSSGSFNFNNCLSCMPAEIKDLIMGLTQLDPTSRLIAEKVALNHPAMLLPIYPDVPPQADMNQDDEPYLDFY
ncbi:Rhoptry kinase family protein ROP23 (incomplete catalytic triad), putative [Eimeria brunetti]|uniref:Rhoptry kinase family protein ROP23 (Incomplete catalytic triad), putative n=1 Tax=Eimeria brunetti TaxID=51314 RepID=U6LAJ8_9EIME|nr:Rhoptry kinase family protein ROP23 (incomplete catalytic triad), putative [Eimeria brunetti]